MARKGHKKAFYKVYFISEHTLWLMQLLLKVKRRQDDKNNWIERLQRIGKLYKHPKNFMEKVDYRERCDLIFKMGTAPRNRGVGTSILRPKPCHHQEIGTFLKVSSLKKELINPFVDATFWNLNFHFKYLANWASLILPSEVFIASLIFWKQQIIL